ncbi:MAG: hypothetical protein VST72_07570 [Nitrospirota bacterium]|nr:hypothetical protein [Nitrospirota bacterium]
MIKKTGAIVLSLIFILAFVPVSLAAGKQRQITGKVLSVDARTGTVTVIGRKGVVTVSAIEDTRIIVEEVKAIDDIKVGDKVTVRYSQAEDRNIARRIAVRADVK